MDKILLDTDVVINILKKREETIAKINSLGDCEFYISTIVIAEIYAGAKESEISKIEQLFSYFITLDIVSDIGRIAGKYAKHYRAAFSGISLEDYMIAATAKYHNLKLWTYNQKHYPMQDIEKI